MLGEVMLMFYLSFIVSGDGSLGLCGLSVAGLRLMMHFFGSLVV